MSTADIVFLAFASALLLVVTVLRVRLVDQVNAASEPDQHVRRFFVSKWEYLAVLAPHKRLYPESRLRLAFGLSIVAFLATPILWGLFSH